MARVGYTRVSTVEDEVTLEMVPVSFDIVKPGESLIEVETETSTA